MSQQKNNSEIILVLGTGPATIRSLSLIGERLPHLSVLLGMYEGEGKKMGGLTEKVYLSKGKEIDQIRRQLGGRKLVGVLNRFDSYIQLMAMVVEAFGIPGPTFEAVMCFKDKSKMDLLMRENGLSEFRPDTRTVALADVKKTLHMGGWPKVVKPYMGSKSRGVFVLHNQQEAAEALVYLHEHFDSDRMFRTDESEDKVMVEEFIGGTQITCSGWVDHNGKLTILGFEDVLNGRDVGQEHQQLVYRSVPSNGPDWVKEGITRLLAKLIHHSHLRSTFIFPDFIYTQDRLYIMELNVRIGGFRSEMYRYAYGVELDYMAIEIALGKTPTYTPTLDGSCTAVEVWEEESGIVNQVELPNDETIKDLKKYYQKGDTYLAPPMANEPLARFYVDDPTGKSKKKALALRKMVKVEYQ